MAKLLSNNKALIIFIFSLCLSLVNFAQTTPITLSGLSLWLRADSGIVLNGANVTDWNDISGNSNNAVAQASPTKWPLYVNSSPGINNKAAVKFTNGYMTLNTNPVIGNNAYTIFMISKVNPYQSSSYVYDFGVSNNHCMLTYNNGTNYGLYDGFFQTPISLPSDSNNYFIYHKVYNTANTPDGVISFNELTFNAGNSPPSAEPTLKFIGGSSSGANMQGEIAEIIVYNRELSSIEINTIQNYLQIRYATPAVNLGPDIIATNFCPIILDPINNYKSVKWQDNSTLSTYTVTTSGQYHIDAVNQFNLHSFDTINILYPVLNYINDTSICQGTSTKWDIKLPKDQFTFSWSDSSSDSVITISAAGNYHVKVTDLLNCFVESNTVTVAVDNFPSVASLGPDTNICSGNPIYLKHGLQQGLTYTWSTSTNNDSIYITTTGQYSVSITNTNSCVAIDTINVTVVGQAPAASFTNSIGCKNNLVTFNDNSTPPSGNTISSWFWNYGDNTSLGDTSHLQNPFYTFADTGNFNVSLTIATNVGCKQSMVKTIHIAPLPGVNFNNVIACKNDTALFTNAITTAGYPTTSYHWDFGDPASGSSNISLLGNPKHLFSQQQSYSVKLIVINNAGCIDSISKNINVKAQVTASFTNSIPCTNTAITFLDNSTAPSPNNQNIRIWNFGTSTSTGLSVTKSFTLAGTYPVTLTVNGLNGCVSSITKQINVMLPPIGNFAISPICLNDISQPIDQSIAQNGTITNWNWLLNNTSISTIQTPTLSPTTASTYSVKLVVTNSYGCKDSTGHPFTVLPLPNVDFTTNPLSFYYINLPVVFAPTITNGSLYNWTINSIPFTIQSPTVTFNSAGTYSATLFMKDGLGCGNTKTKIITVANKFVDLAILSVRTSQSPDNYISVEVDLGNFGTVPVSSFDINYQITDASSIQESWSGMINPGGFLTYKFNAKSQPKNGSSNNITCANIVSVNHTIDDNTSNNKNCGTPNSDLNVLNPYPNPTDGDLTLPIVLDKNTEFKIELFNAFGQIISDEIIVEGFQGLNQITVPTSSLAKGSYIMKISLNEKTYVKKFQKNTKE